MANSTHRKQVMRIRGTASKGGRSVTVGESKSPFAHVVEGYERSLFLGPFLEAGRVPSVADVEIAACFADLRGFTKYVHAVQSNWQDRRVQEFLVAYFRL